jgi:N-acyl homoserine lactone hydrolase
MRPSSIRFELPVRRFVARTACRMQLVALGLLALASLAVWGLSGPAQGQGAQPVSALRLYIFDCGHLVSANPKPLLDRGVTVTDMSVPCYLIAHPRGTLLWETGAILDEQVKPGGTTVARATVKKTLSSQLVEVGHKPSDITYLALSHYHYDHSANANAYAGSPWLVQKQERAAMFGELKVLTPILPEVSDKYSALKTSTTIVLDGDHDVFGDGSVVILATPGHTPGHQSLFVKLAKSQPVVLSGDLYHYPAERELKDFLPFAGRWNDEQEASSKARVEAFLKEKGAALWIQHDLIADSKLRKSPNFYE